MEDKPIIFFDGVCNLCSGAVQKIITYDKNNIFLFASLQSQTADKLLKEFKTQNPKVDSIILLQNNKISTKSRAVLNIAKQFNFPYNLAYGLIIIPTFISNFFYDIVAKNRYKWFGQKEECWIPTPQIKAKFLH